MSDKDLEAAVKALKIGNRSGSWNALSDEIDVFSFNDPEDSAVPSICDVKHVVLAAENYGPDYFEVEFSAQFLEPTMAFCGGGEGKLGVLRSLDGRTLQIKALAVGIRNACKCDWFCEGRPHRLKSETVTLLHS